MATGILVTFDSIGIGTHNSSTHDSNLNLVGKISVNILGSIINGLADRIIEVLATLEVSEVVLVGAVDASSEEGKVHLEVLGLGCIGKEQVWVVVVSGMVDGGHQQTGQNIIRPLGMDRLQVLPGLVGNAMGVALLRHHLDIFIVLVMHGQALVHVPGNHIDNCLL